MTEDAAFYTRALGRVDQFALAVAVAAVIGAFIWQGWRGGVGCAIGAAISFVNLRLWKRLANAIGAEGKPPARGSPVLLGLRYLLLGGMIFVIIKYFEVSFLAILAGLFTGVAAILLEIVYELIFTSRKT